MRTIYYIKTRLILFVKVGLILTSCTKYDLEPTIKPSEGLNIIIGNQVKITSNEIDYYDNSSKLFYMNSNLPYKFTDFNGSKFWITDNQDPVLTGAVRIDCQCGVDSLIKTELIIAEGYHSYIVSLRKSFSNQRYFFSDDDERENELFINTLKKYRKYRSGISIDFDKIERIDWNHIQLKLKITNLDTVSYYLLDPERMETRLYHYLTSGLTLRNTDNNKFFDNNVKPNYTSEIDFGYEKWLTLIENGEEMYVTIDYPQFDSIAPGKYTASFSFPGLTYQVLEKNDLKMDNGTIWLGKLDLKEEVILN